MSHTAQCGNEVTNINSDLLKKTVEIVAARFKGGKVSDSIDSVDEGDKLTHWCGKRFCREKKCGNKFFACIRTKNLPQGIGLMLSKDGKLTFHADKLYVAERLGSYHREGSFDELKREAEKEIKDLEKDINSIYKQLVLTLALESEGFEVSRTEQPDGSIIVHALKE